MNADPQPPQQPLSTTTQILKQTCHVTILHLPTLLLLSSLLFSLRSSVDSATLSLTSFIDHDPSFHSLLSRLHPNPNHNHNQQIIGHRSRHHHRRRSFLQLTRVGTLEDGFFSSEDTDNRFFGAVTVAEPNASVLIVDAFGFLNSVIEDNGIRVSEVARPNSKLSFKLGRASQSDGQDRLARPTGGHQMILDLSNQNGDGDGDRKDDSNMSHDSNNMSHDDSSMDELRGTQQNGDGDDNNGIRVSEMVRSDAKLSFKLAQSDGPVKLDRPVRPIGTSSSSQSRQSDGLVKSSVRPIGRNSDEFREVQTEENKFMIQDLSKQIADNGNGDGNDDSNMDELRQNKQLKQNRNDGNDDSNMDELQRFFQKFELEHREMTSLLFLLSVLSASYGFAIFGFVVTYAWVLGIVFVVVVNDLVKGERSVVRTVWEGSNLGLKRLSGYIVMRWAMRDALTQLLGVWFFGEIEDQYLFFKVFVRLKLMPFSIASPWVKGLEMEVYSFLLSWFVLDTLISFVFAVDAWVAMVDTRKSVKEVVKEGCHLLGLMLHPAIHLKCLECIVCGSFARWLLSRVFGKLVASGLQSFMEVYFMVAWLLYYFSVKSKDASASGTQFGQRELEGLLEDVR